MSTLITKRSTLTAKRCYLDHASTTPLDQRVRRVMEPFFARDFGNPSSIHAEGVAAKKAIDEARTKIARCLEAHAEEIIFTSGGTEANNLAIFGALAAFTRSGLVKAHIVTTNIEHSSVLEPLRALERLGRAEVSYVPVESDGIVSPEKVIAAIRQSTVLVSVMYANNEIGTIQPIRRIGKMMYDLRFRNYESRSRRLNAKRSTLNIRNEKAYPLFHCDACQAPLYLNCLVNALGVDLLTLDGHKLYGPKGVGALYVRRGTPLTPQIFGGGQERGLRSTTENMPGIVGFAEAIRIATVEREKESARVERLRDHLYFLIRANKHIDRRVVVNGSMKENERLPSNLNISLPGVDTEFLTLQLDAAGIACSTKSSCLKGERESYVIRALGGGEERARSTVRFTLGRDTRKTDIDRTAETLLRLL